VSCPGAVLGRSLVHFQVLEVHVMCRSGIHTSLLTERCPSLVALVVSRCLSGVVKGLHRLGSPRASSSTGGAHALFGQDCSDPPRA
jgi:hypothetical protein